MSLKTWKRRLLAYEDRLPFPEPGTEYWKTFFTRIGALGKLADHEPDFVATLAEYFRLQALLDEAGLEMHNRLGEMLLRRQKDELAGPMSEM
jgi:hypothetical protein